LALIGSKRILIAPLDWGLGHTSRCLPLIRYLQALGHKVIVAGNDSQRRFMKKACPGVDTLPLDGYDIRYSKGSAGFMFSMFRQLPGVLASVRNEHGWLTEQAAKHGFDGIISDNRYGLFHKRIPSVIMTHQVAVSTGLGRVADEIVRRLHSKYLQRFDNCWIVDAAGERNLGGKLSHPKLIPANAAYMGLLSQFDVSNNRDGDHLLVLLSGPEPQRTILAQKLWLQLQAYKGKVVFVEGSDKVKQPLLIPTHIEWHGRLATNELQPLIQNARMVICRSGYSTLMDLTAMGKKAIVIPTPGQTEQKYLAKHLHREGVFFAASQRRFILQQALDSAKLFPFKQLGLQDAFEGYKTTIDNWLQTL
jgi:UDP-N-acetylglucosamine transferase subunit ALG13